MPGSGWRCCITVASCRSSRPGWSALLRYGCCGARPPPRSSSRRAPRRPCTRRTWPHSTGFDRPGHGRSVRCEPRQVALEPLQVIAAPKRLRILELVWDQELSAGDIAAQFDVSWSAVSQHLRVLKDAGFVVERREGTSRIYRADKAALGSLRSAVEDYWRHSLGWVKDLAEAEQRDRDRT